MAMDEKAKQVVAQLEQIIPIIGKMGVKIEEFEQGRVKVLLPIKHNLNHIGIAYAGSLFSLADYTAGVLFYATFDTSKYYPILKEATIKYKKPATTDVTIDASVPPEEAALMTKTAEETGKSDWPLELELKNSQGEVCTILNGVFQMRKR